MRKAARPPSVRIAIGMLFMCIGDGRQKEDERLIAGDNQKERDGQQKSLGIAQGVEHADAVMRRF